MDEESGAQIALGNFNDLVGGGVSSTVLEMFLGEWQRAEADFPETAEKRD